MGTKENVEYITRQLEGAKNKDSERRRIKVVDGVHFVWVPKYEESTSLPHWLPITHSLVVVARVYEPQPGEEEWMVIPFKAGVYPFEYHDDETYKGTQKIAWEKAVRWAKRTEVVHGNKKES